MARLPNNGGDEGRWGEILNDYLSQSHDSTGALKSGIIDTRHIKDGAVTDAKISDTADIAQSKIHNLTTDLIGKASTSDPRFTDTRTPTDSSVTPTKLAGSPSVTTGHGVTWNGSAWVSTDLVTQTELDALTAGSLALPRELGYLVKQDGSFTSTTTYTYPTTGEDVPGTTLTITKGSRPIMIRVKVGNLTNTSTAQTVLTLLEDGVDVDNATMDIRVANRGTGTTLEYRSTVAAGVHTYKLRLSVSGGTGLVAADGIFPLQMSVTEVVT